MPNQPSKKKTTKKTLENKSKNNEDPGVSSLPSPQNSKTIPVIVTKSSKNYMYKHDGTFNQAGLFELLGNDIRRRILSKLAKFPRYASDLAIDLNVSKQAVKKHLDKMIEFGIVEEAPSQGDQKKQYFQITSRAALFAQVDITPNFFSVAAQNRPEDLIKGISQMEHNPTTAITSSTRAGIDYNQLNFALKAVGAQLQEVESRLLELEKVRKEVLMEKTVLLNRIQMIINALVEDDLEKEVIFSLFFDVKSSLKGVSLQDILEQLFLRKKQRAGVSKYQYKKVDERTKKRGQDLLKLLQLLISNFGFIRTTEGGQKLFFDFSFED